MREGWVKRKVKDVVIDLHQGLNTAGYKIKFYDKGYPIIQTRNLENGVIDLEEKMKFMSKEDWLIYKDKYKPKIGDVFLTNIGTIGKTAVVTREEDYLIHWNIFIFKIDKKVIDPFYLKTFLETPFCFDYYKSFQKGGTVNFITKKIIESLEIPLPSLPEQQRIVSILDEAFAAIAQAKANAEQNLKNAKELFESYLQGVFENKGEGWEEKKLGQIAKVIGGYSFKSGDFIEQGRYQVIRMGNVRPGIIRENENPVFIDKLDDAVLKRALLLCNDVIITQTGTKKKRDYGFTVIINKDNYLLNQRISAIRFSENYLPKFFLYYSWTNLFKDQYFANETGTVGQGNVGIGAITEAMIPFLPLREQQVIVKKLDALYTETEKLEAIYQKKTEDLEELKKSVLQKAFRGELCEQDFKGLKEYRIMKNAVVV